MVIRSGVTCFNFLIVEEMTEHVGTWEEHFAAQAVSPVDLEAIRACFYGGVL
jgi:hypothetical protein